MQRTVFHIIASGLAAGFVSVIYFLLLAAGASPFAIIVLAAVAGIFLLAKYYMKNVKLWLPADEKRSFLLPVVLAVAVVTIVAKAYPLTEEYGGWDAWSIWNLQAKYLASEHWYHLLLNTRFGHPDYPLMVPALIAFCSRSLPGISIETVAFALSFCITLLIPVVIFLHTAGRSMFVATYVLFMLAMNKYYLGQGVSMYADTWLAFYFLCALISVKQQLSGHKHILLAAGCLGCCIWTKNEGAVLVAVFCAFYGKELFFGGRIRYFVAGIALPILVLVFFKVAYAPQNDIVSGFTGDTLRQLGDTERYGKILTSFHDNIDHKFSYMKAGALIYGIICLLKRQWPGKDILMILTCAAAYFVVYLVSSMDLDWHLLTSSDRLLHQLMPAAVLVIAERISGPWSNMSVRKMKG